MIDLVSQNPMIQLSAAAMTLANRRMGLIAANLANIDTPNYHTKDFKFEAAFNNAMADMDRQLSPIPSTPSYFHSSSSVSAPEIIDPVDITSERNDGNDVHLDRETMNLSKAQETFQLASNFAQTELKKVLGAIRDAAAK